MGAFHRAILVATLLFLSNTIFSAPITHWVEIKTRLTIGAENDPPKELTVSDECLPIQIGITVDKGEILKAVLTDRTGVTAAGLALLPSEFERIELYQDPTGRYWIRSLPLNERLLSWGLRSRCLFQNVNWKSVEDEPSPFLFPMEGMGVEALLSVSQMESFRGRLHDKNSTPYRAWTVLIQGKGHTEGK